MLGCSKKSYASWFGAKRALRAIRRKNLALGKKAPTRIYPCDSCKALHLTSHGIAKERFAGGRS